MQFHVNWLHVFKVGMKYDVYQSIPLLKQEKKCRAGFWTSGLDDWIFGLLWYAILIKDYVAHE